MLSPMTAASALRTVTAEEARLLLLDLQGLLVDPARRATPLTVGRHIEELGFVQLDSINVLERAHHLTLAARFDGYYVLPLLEGDRLVGRADLKFDRPKKTLEVRGLWWESGVRVDRARRARFDGALARMQRLLGAASIRPSP